MAVLMTKNPLELSDDEKLAFLEEITANAGAVQDRVLAEILSQNAETEYLRRYGLGGATDRATFKAKIPVVAYEDVRPDIERIANGDRSAVLSGKPVREFFVSSGTSGGKRKLRPVIVDDFHRAIIFGILCEAVVKHNLPGLDKGKGMDFIVLRSATKTPGGFTAQEVSASLYKASVGEHWAQTNTCPAAVLHCPDYFQSMYVQLLSGLYQRSQVVQIGAAFAAGLMRAIHFFRDNWPQLVRDIETGSLTDKIVDQSLRNSVSDLLKPDPELANFVADQCSSADWSGILTKIWPNVKCLRTIATGAMLQYRPMLQSYGDGLPIVSTLYGCSESFLGINLDPLRDPLDVSYTLLPNIAYFEFIPHNSATDELVDMTKVEVGKMYEPVVTTYAGLYRYQIGDVLEVTGFHNAAPQFKVVGRKGMVLAIETDKTDEVELQKAVDNASELIKPYGATVMEYTSFADTKSRPGHYVIYWELMLGDVDGEVLDNCCSVMEEAMNQVYKEKRASNDIGPLEIRIVKNGTFWELMDHAVSKGTSANQYKVPRCVQRPDIIELLDSRIVSTHFSPACPRLD